MTNQPILNTQRLSAGLQMHRNPTNQEVKASLHNSHNYISNTNAYNTYNTCNTNPSSNTWIERNIAKYCHQNKQRKPTSVNRTGLAQLYNTSSKLYPRQGNIPLHPKEDAKSHHQQFRLATQGAENDQNQAHQLQMDIHQNAEALDLSQTENLDPNEEGRVGEVITGL